MTRTQEVQRKINVYASSDIQFLSFPGKVGNQYTYIEIEMENNYIPHPSEEIHNKLPNTQTHTCTYDIYHISYIYKKQMKV